MTQSHERASAGITRASRQPSPARRLMSAYNDAPLGVKVGLPATAGLIVLALTEAGCGTTVDKPAATATVPANPTACPVPTENNGPSADSGVASANAAKTSKDVYNINPNCANGENLALPNTIPLKEGETFTDLTPLEKASLWVSNGKNLDSQHLEIYNAMKDSMLSSDAAIVNPNNLNQLPLGTVLNPADYPPYYFQFLSGEPVFPVLSGYLGAQDVVDSNGNVQSTMIFALSGDNGKTNGIIFMPSAAGQGIRTVEAGSVSSQSNLPISTLEQGLSSQTGKGVVLIFEDLGVWEQRHGHPTPANWQINDAQTLLLENYLKGTASKPDFFITGFNNPIPEPNNPAATELPIKIGPFVRQFVISPA